MSVIHKDAGSILVKCACHNHMLEVILDEFDTESVPFVNMSIWSLGQRPLKLRWRDRLRWCWYLLKDGTLHGDDILLDETDSLELARFLAAKSKSIKNATYLLKVRYEKKSSKPCKCWSCRYFPKISKFEKSLDADKLIEFRALFEEIWDRLEAVETDLGVLNAKIDGSWPKDEKNEPYLHRIGDKLYKIESSVVES